MSESEIFSSTGTLGTSERQAGRLYHNAETSSHDASLVFQVFGELVRAIGDRPDLGRAVFRGTVSDRAMQELRIDQNLEVALPLKEFGHTGWLVYLSRNDSSRTSPTPAEQIRQETELPTYKPSTRLPHQRVEQVIADGDEIRTTLDAQDYDALHELWGPTFGWTRDHTKDEIAALAERVRREETVAEPERTVWFAATYSGKVLVSAAMAERLTIPGPNGPLDIVENTEWCTRRGDQYRDCGYMAATVAAVNGQVLHSLRNSPNGHPLIYAECNFTSRSDRVGHAVGLRIPSRYYARQILAQNVTLDDGVEPAGLRDFSFMYLPRHLQESHYGEAQRARIMDALATGAVL